MVGLAEALNNEKMTALFHAANAHPRMEGIYEKYFNGWTNAGGDPLLLLSLSQQLGQIRQLGRYAILR